MKRVLTLTIALIAIFALTTGCGSSETGGAADKGIAGTSWALSGGEMSGVEVSAEDVAALVGEMTMNFKDNGKVVMAIAGMEEESDYTQDGNTISFTSGAEAITATVDGDEMKMDIMGITLKFAKK